MAASDRWAAARLSGYGRPWVISVDGGGYEMWFAARGSAYRLSYASSADGLTWTRSHPRGDVPPADTAWASESVEYRALLQHGDGAEDDHLRHQVRGAGQARGAFPLVDDPFLDQLTDGGGGAREARSDREAQQDRGGRAARDGAAGAPDRAFRNAALVPPVGLSGPVRASSGMVSQWTFPSAAIAVSMPWASIISRRRCIFSKAAL